jgi:hypothetical protein
MPTKWQAHGFRKRERDKERRRERQTDRQTDRQTERETNRQMGSEDLVAGPAATASVVKRQPAGGDEGFAAPGKYKNSILGRGRGHEELLLPLE